MASVGYALFIMAPLNPNSVCQTEIYTIAFSIFYTYSTELYKYLKYWSTITRIKRPSLKLIVCIYFNITKVLCKFRIISNTEVMLWCLNSMSFSVTNEIFIWKSFHLNNSQFLSLTDLMNYSKAVYFFLLFECIRNYWFQIKSFVSIDKNYKNSFSIYKWNGLYS